MALFNENEWLAESFSLKGSYMYLDDDICSAWGEEASDYVRRTNKLVKKIFKKHKWKTKDGRKINLLDRSQCDDFHFQNICKCLSEKFKFRQELIDKLKLERGM